MARFGKYILTVLMLYRAIRFHLAPAPPLSAAGVLAADLVAFSAQATPLGSRRCGRISKPLAEGLSSAPPRYRDEELLRLFPPYLYLCKSGFLGFCRESDWLLLQVSMEFCLQGFTTSCSNGGLIVGQAFLCAWPSCLLFGCCAVMS